MRRHFYLTWPLIVLFAISCGGGGKKGSDSQVSVLNVPSGSGAEKQLKGAKIVVEPGTFATDAQVTIERRLPNQYRSPNLDIVTNSVGVVLRTSTVPNKDLKVVFPAPTQSGEVVIFAQTNAEEEPWIELEASKVGQTLEVRVPHENLGRSRGSHSTINGPIGTGLIPVANPPDQGYDLIKVAGQGELGAGSVILVHGFNNSFPDLAPLGEKLVSRGLYRNAFAVSYDWRLPPDQPAAYLRDRLRELRAFPKSVDIVSHSLGGVIVRFALEEFGETLAVRNAVFVCSPHQGLLTAELSGMLRGLRRNYISYAGKPFKHRGISNFDTPSLANLQNESQFMRKLATPSGQRGHVNYYALAANSDLVVNTNNGLASRTQLEEFTAGRIERLAEPGGHSTLVKKDSGIKRLVDLIAAFVARAGSGLTLTLEPNPVEVNTSFFFEGWVWSVIVQNNTAASITLKTLTFDSFNKNGEWLGVVWYSQATPGGEFFPWEFHGWDLALPPGEEVLLRIGDVPDRNKHSGLTIDEVPEEMRARSLEHTLTYTDGNGQLQTISMLTEYYGNLWPATPNTRAERINGRPLGIGQIKPPVVRRISP